MKNQHMMTCQPLFEFHVSRLARDRYQFDQKLFAQHGNVIFTDFYSVRIFADKMNRQRNLISSPEKTIKAGALNAMGLIDEILHHIFGLFKEQKNKTVVADAEKELINKIGQSHYHALLSAFIDKFPPLSVYRNEINESDYLKKKTAGVKNSQIILEEIALIWLANQNQAFSPFKELFDDETLTKTTKYRQVYSLLYAFFSKQSRFGPNNQNLLEMLAAPAKKHPSSLTAQLEYIRNHWGYLLSKYIYRLFSSLDLIKEEEKAIFAGPGPSYVPEFAVLGDDEYERFSTDLDWMPKVVMIAKSTFVWLDQISKKYSRLIQTLDQIPDQELDILSERGFTALWLIGLWERSPASKKIKQISGNPEAVSSAYSLYDYQIASELGGYAAFDNLKKRAWARGIRLTSDMVPNHTGIYSKWMVEHPDWFIQNDYPVFPSYTFNGPNLSDDDRIGLYIEDGYWNRNDAAVVFKRVDHHNGSARYIYHGNDGTSMPWNDTAQLNFLLPEVREAVIQTVLHVARQFPIIRLDAAMTLAKRHFQRLWFPQPGTGGDIPSRSEFGLSKEEFNRLFPVEFWREVVDRVAQEVPDTLLLAEAFWMMEGYFVRTLGMHRVYNSAFMNMLKNEDNQEYRQSIKNVMDFNPEIMKRYVNFMNNPDEETAVAQFGKDDKYFGVCTLMCTLPGLPMFGHGQIEGLSEKYGMEYMRAYWDEHEDHHLIERHYREIFPLLKKRYLFSEVRNFILYDLIGPDGYVNENVFAYSNRHGNEKALVLYNNRYQRSSGWIKYSSASAQKEGDYFRQYSLAEGLQLQTDENRFLVFRDQVSNLEYIRHHSEFIHHGLYVELDGFKYHVFLDFHEVQENEYHHYAQLTDYLAGRGVPSIEQALRETFLKPVHEPFAHLINADFLRSVQKKVSAKGRGKMPSEQHAENLKTDYQKFLERLAAYTECHKDYQYLIKLLLNKYNNLLNINNPVLIAGLKTSAPLARVTTFLEENSPNIPMLMIWSVVADLGNLRDESYSNVISLAWIDELLMNKFILLSLQELGLDDFIADRQLLLIKILTLLPDWLDHAVENPGSAFHSLFQYQEVQKFLDVNQYHDILYFHYESLIEMLTSFLSIALMQISEQDRADKVLVKKKIMNKFKLIDNVIRIAADLSCQVYPLIDRIKSIKVTK